MHLISRTLEGGLQSAEVTAMKGGDALIKPNRPPTVNPGAVFSVRACVCVCVSVRRYGQPCQPSWPSLLVIAARGTGKTLRKVVSNTVAEEREETGQNMGLIGYQFMDRADVSGAGSDQKRIR